MATMSKPNRKPQDGNDFLSIINRREVREVIYQIIIVVVLAAFFWMIVTNTITNLRKQNIASGFGFWDQIAGFDISQTLIEYTARSSYGRAFWAGLLNTVIVSAIGIVLATIVGFTMGMARLSSNWLIARIGTVYVEIARNVPLLLQLLVWYFAVLKPLPEVFKRDAAGEFMMVDGKRVSGSIEIVNGVLLNNRGLYVPRPEWQGGSLMVLWALLFGIAASILIAMWSRRRQMATGQRFPVFLTSLALIVAAADRRVLPDRTARHSRIPRARPLQSRRRPRSPTRVHGPAARPRLLHRRLHRRDRPGRYPGCRQGTEGSGARPRLVDGADAAPRGHPASDAHHHPAADEPVSQPDQELVAGRGHRLSGSRRRVRGHRAQPDRPGDRGDLHHHARLPDTVASPRRCS